MEDIKTILIKNIKKHRARLEMSQFALAEEMGVSEDTIARIETGRQFPSHSTFNKLIKIFDIKPYQLFVGEDEAFSKEKYIDIVYPQITKEIRKIMRNTNIADKK